MIDPCSKHGYNQMVIVQNIPHIIVIKDGKGYAGDPIADSERWEGACNGNGCGHWDNWYNTEEVKAP